MNDFSSIRAGILGSTGYTGRELVRILLGHPNVEIAFATSESEAGKPLRSISPRADDQKLIPSAEAPLGDVDVVFSCLPHGASIEWVEKIRGAGTRAIDLSADLRVLSDSTPAWATDVVYGLPELHRDSIRGASLIANPGCYPTAATLSIAPIAKRGWVGKGPVIINAASGVTGAGRSPKRELLFAEVGEDYRAYAVGNVHRHLAEMKDQIGRLAGNGPPEMVFSPHLLPVRRGILETIYIPLDDGIAMQDAKDAYVEDYEDEPFIRLLDGESPKLVNVTGTNVVEISPIEVRGIETRMLMVLAAEDNLVKGAAGQAVQNLNLMFGIPETEGLF